MLSKIDFSKGRAAVSEPLPVLDSKFAVSPRLSRATTGGSIDPAAPLPSPTDQPAYLGVLRKPSQCSQCAYRTVGAGFCPDWVPPRPRLAFLLEAPGENEILQRAPLVGKAGKLWESRLLRPLGLTRDDCLISNVARCRPPGNEYPDGSVAKHVGHVCRQYDDFHGGSNGELVEGGLKSYNPNAFVVSFHPSMLSRAPMTLRLIRRAIERALGLEARGYRVCVLMGDVATSLVAPYLTGGLKRWSGHWFLGKWPFSAML